MALKILIAEDNQKIADAYFKILTARGHQVTITYDGEQCIKKYKSELKSGNLKNNVPYDVVVMDFSMPKKDGAETVGEILDERPQQRILFATAFENEMIKKFNKIRRPVEVLNKPFTMKSLVQSLETKVNAIPKNKLNPRVFRKWDENSGLSYAGPGPSRSGATQSISKVKN